MGDWGRQPGRKRGREKGRKGLTGQASHGRHHFYLASRSATRVPLPAKLQFSIWFILATSKDNYF